ncbi:MAG: flagellin [Deltaproteobacteria bacterium]|jgi:flagellin|nr:flagellin [Deltaproteobacteria bacterium]
MALIINHNMTAQNAARNLGTIYDRLSTSVRRLSSGLRINSAADDAAGLAIREMMRADIATMKQGIRNTADAISMIQTADGALGVIDEKLVRMKELAEQAATGTYTTAQREIINSEYQAMAAEIDRIANATNFNGIKLLDGSVTNQHGGQGLKIHFGVSNNPSEDYYFVNIGDARATSSTGLRVGGDAKNDIWGQGAAGSSKLAGPGCCTAGYATLDNKAGFKSGETFEYGYNWDWTQNKDSALLTGKYLAGRYTVTSSDSLQDLVNKVNAGSQSRVGVAMSASILLKMAISGGNLAVCVGDEAYVFGSSAAARGDATKAGFVDSSKSIISVATSASKISAFTATSLASAINNNTNSKFWAMVQSADSTGKKADMLYIFTKAGGNYNNILACDVADNKTVSRSGLAGVSFENVQSSKRYESGTTFTLGGEHWGTMKPTQAKAKLGNEVWNVTLNGRDVGDERDLWIANSGEVKKPGLKGGVINGMDRNSFVEIQNAANGQWVGAELRTQSAAQEALDAMTGAINKKDKIRADLGALQNRLQNTMTNLTIQAENLQASESRISDVDVAVEMTEFTKNNVLAQAATSMLAQANSLSQLALSLIG